MGTRHRFNYGINDCTGTTTGDGTTNDGSGLTFNGAVHTSSGETLNVLTIVSGGPSSLQQTITDSNGNQITGTSAAVFTDTLGTNALTITGAGSASSPKVFTYLVPTSGNAAATLNYSTRTVQTKFSSSSIGEYGPQPIDLPSTLVFNDGTTNYTYTFNYEPTPGVAGNVTGRLSSITLPMGGTITYAYTGGACSGINADGTAGILKRITSDGTTTYSSAPNGTAATKTTVTDATTAANQSVYSFADVSGVLYETLRTIWQGAAGSSALLDIYKCYNGTPAPCDAAAITLPISSVVTISSQNGGPQATTTTNYQAPGYQPGALVSSVAQTDYGNATPLVITTYGYGSVGNVTSVVQSTGTTTIAKTIYTPDGSTPTASEAPQHVAATGPRGNVTFRQTYIDPNNHIDTSASYYDTGLPVSSTGPAGPTNNTTSYTYDSAAKAFITNLSLPTPSSGVALAASGTTDINSGVPLTSVDLNANTTTHKTYDKLLRPLEVDYPDGGKTTVYYSVNQQSLHNYQNANTFADTETLYDGYGRISRTAVANGQGANPWYQQDICYNANGGVRFQSYRYQGNGWPTPQVCSGAGDTYSYDGLGRVTSVTHADNTSIQYSYTGRATKITDENGGAKISQVDGLGRPSGVCEVSSSTLQGVSPTIWGLDIPGTGFLTTYAYDLANHKTTVSQGAQTRVFQTDWLGRTTSVTEPERGATTYSYAYNTTGLVVTRNRPKANQTNSSVLTTTTTQYDVLGRPASITYTNNGVADTLTTNPGFAYDTNQYWAQSPANMKGRLVVTGRGTGPTWTGGLFSYDAMGRVSNIWSCGPSTCGTSNQASHVLGFTYDLAGNVTQRYDPVSGLINYGRSLAGEITAIVNATYQLNGTPVTGAPANLISGVQNGPNGPSTYSYGNGLSQYYQYNSLANVVGGWVCVGAPSQGCPNQRTGYFFNMTGNQIFGEDNITGQNTQHSYDEFGRLTATDMRNSGHPNYTYSYDRYGNILSQSGSGYNATYNAANNQIVGYSYDAAGNLSNDGLHGYTYDAEGNVLQVDGGTTAQFVYDALNHRVRAQTGGSVLEYVYDYAGRNTSTWLPGATTGLEGRIYWDGRQIAFRSSDGKTYYDHQDWMTERARTDPNGNLVATYYSLPFGDGYAPTLYTAAAGLDPLHFAGLDQDNNTSNAPMSDHAQFRQYNFNQGRWQSPDPYYGSYNFANPQSFNRYAYVGNNPLAYIDPDGTSDECVDGCSDQNGNVYYGGTQGLSGGTDTTVVVDGSGNGPSFADLQSWSFNLTQGQGFSGSVSGGIGQNNTPVQPEKPQSPLAKYAVFLGCELNHNIEQLADEEDAQNPKQIPIVVTAAAVVGAIKGILPGWTGITGVITGGLYVINIASNSNIECTKSTYGH